MEKNKKSNFGVYLVLMIVFAVISFIGGTILTLYMSEAMPNFAEIDYTVDGILELLEGAMSQENYWLYTGGCFAAFMLLIFLSATRDYNNTPRTLTNKNYDVDSDKKGSARWLTDKEINDMFFGDTIKYEDALIFAYIKGSLEGFLYEGRIKQVVIDEEGITVGLNSTRIDDSGVYVGAHNYDDAKVAMSEDGKLKAADGLFEVYANGTMVAQSGVFANGAVRIDGDGTLRVGGSGNDANVIIYKEGPTSISAKGEVHAGGFATTGDVVANGAIAGGTVVSTGQIAATGDIFTTGGDVKAGDVSLNDLADKVGQNSDAINANVSAIKQNADSVTLK